MTIDYSPLTETVSKADLDAFRKKEQNATSTTIALVVALAVCALFVFLVFGLIRTELEGQGRPGQIALIVLVAAGIGTAAFFVSRLLLRASLLRRYRLTRFAVRNEMLYSKTPISPQLPGSLFGVGSSRSVQERLWRTETPNLELGNYQFTTGSGKNRRTHNWSYLGLRLPRRLPHMLLDSKGNNSLFGSNLPFRVNRNQRLSLEGDFDEHFTLYCPREYETDALYLFTPDLMALLIDEASEFDVEIIDDWMLIYRNATIDLSDAVELARVFAVVDTVGAKTRMRSTRYADDRVLGGDGNTAPRALHAQQENAGASIGSRLRHNLIAPRGQRLATGVSWITMGAVAAVVIVWAVLRYFIGV